MTMLRRRPSEQQPQAADGEEPLAGDQEDPQASDGEEPQAGDQDGPAGQRR